jgi:unsaturated chondroitin disaccharide hydrolase
MRTAERARALLVERVRTTLEQVGDDFPYVADPSTGVWQVTDDGNWCGGHWIGLLWIAHEVTGEDRFAAAARDATERMRAVLPADNMFYGMNNHYAGFRAYDVTGDDDYRAIGVDGAERTAGFFHEFARQVPLGTLAIEAPAENFRGPEDDDAGPSGARLGAVDAVYTALLVLWRAYEETGDPHYRDVAVSHADRHLDWYVRPDGSTWHHVEFDPETGDQVRAYNELAYSDETCWARGQGWCIAGLARAYRETKAERYRHALEHVVDYYVDQSPADLVPHWDFEHPDKPAVDRDTSAAALAAYGLTGLPDADETESLRGVGDRILDSLVTDYLTPRGDGEDRPRGMVLESCYNGPAGFATAHEHVWTDYYVLYALHRRVADE